MHKTTLSLYQGGFSHAAVGEFGLTVAARLFLFKPSADFFSGQKWRTLFLERSLCYVPSLQKKDFYSPLCQSSDLFLFSEAKATMPCK